MTTVATPASPQRLVDQKGMDDLKTEMWRLAEILEVTAGILFATPVETGLRGPELDVIISATAVAADIAKRSAADIDQLLMPPAEGFGMSAARPSTMFHVTGTETLRAAIEARIEALIAILDLVDGDADFEPDDDGEPWLGRPEGWTGQGFVQDDRGDDREADDDVELSGHESGIADDDALQSEEFDLAGGLCFDGSGDDLANALIVFR